MHSGGLNMRKNKDGAALTGHRRRVVKRYMSEVPCEDVLYRIVRLYLEKRADGGR